MIRRFHRVRLTGAIVVLGVVIFGVIVPDLAAAERRPSIVDARVGAKQAITRVVFEISDRVRYNIFTLANPERIVIDLEQVAWRLPWRKLRVNSTVIDRVRYGLFRPGTSRIVLDCKRPAKVNEAFVMAPLDGDRHYRFVIDLVEISGTAFLRSIRGARRSQTRAVALLGLPSSPPPRKPRPGRIKRVIVLDPGHGGADPGTIGVSGVYEKRITLVAARLMRDALRRSGRYKVLLTRDRDVFVPLRKRVAHARDAGADLFISIHADANPNGGVRGASVYTLSKRSSDAEAAALAERENKADLIAGVDLTDESPEVANILIDLAQRESMNQSAKFATLLVHDLQRTITLLRNTHRFAGFAVLKAPDVPSVLIELGQLSNGQDERLLRSKRYLKKVAAALVRAIDAYFVGVYEARRM